MTNEEKLNRAKLLRMKAKTLKPSQAEKWNQYTNEAKALEAEVEASGG